MIPTVNSELGRFDAGTALQFVLLSAPQAILFGLPVAYFFAVAMDREPTPPLRLVPGIFGLSVLCTLIMLIIAFAVEPRANQAYRTAVYNHLKAAHASEQQLNSVSFGPEAMTFSALVRSIRSGRSDASSPVARARAGMRLAWCTLPLAFGILALGAANRQSRMATFGMGLWVLALYVVVLRAVSSTTGPSFEAMCVVNAAFTMAGLVMVWSRSKFGDYELRTRV